MAWLGNAYIHGRGVPTDLAKGSGLINSSAEHGDPVGLRFYGLMYQEGVAVAQDLPRAKEFYEKAAAKGDVPSFGRLGMMYLMGKGVPQDRAKGTDLLKAGSAAGDAWAKVELGRVYMTGLSSRDRALAVTEYTEAAQAGNRLAAFRLGRIYQLGYAGQKPDMEKAAHFYSLSAARGYPYGQLGLARLSMTGNGVQKDNVYAYALLMLAAEQGLTQAELYEHQLSQSMSASQIAQASILAQKFKARASQDEQSPPDSQE
jgi:TPR repeat protein